MVYHNIHEMKRKRDHILRLTFSLQIYIFPSFLFYFLSSEWDCFQFVPFDSDILMNKCKKDMHFCNEKLKLIALWRFLLSRETTYFAHENHSAPLRNCQFMTQSGFPSFAQILIQYFNLCMLMKFFFCSDVTIFSLFLEQHSHTPCTIVSSSCYRLIALQIKHPKDHHHQCDHLQKHILAINLQFYP